MELPSEFKREILRLNLQCKCFLKASNSWSDKQSQSRPSTALSAGLAGKKLCLIRLLQHAYDMFVGFDSCLAAPLSY